MLRRTFIIGGVAAALLAAQAPLHAQSGNAQPLLIVVPYGPSGLPDSLARIMGQKITENTGRPVIVENKAGASGIIGAQYFMGRAAADGNTVFLIDDNTYAINPAVYPDLPYKPAVDFTPVTQAIEGPMYLVANTGANIDSVQSLISQAKAKPKAINYGSPGNATIHHLGMEQIALMSGIEMVHIPYKGVAQSTPGLLSGDVSVMFVSLSSVAPHVQAGKLRLLAVGSTERSPLTPDIPTVSESGLPGVKVASNMGFAVRAGTPPDVVQRLNEEMVKALKSPDVTEKIEKLGVRVVANTSEEFSQQIKHDQDLFSRLVKQTGLKVN
ncbi:tripartite tricarboxylate transporter substrate binding protein [Pigmentiphaga sp. CHJ604]|uniref:Bug family tripartite tricarboxylate transporter substrate binding protein n=1 Tax=Pigmentiphaga sp. CHJ604 TaxID=3081984 RepID=UPI0030D0C7F4